MKLSTLTTNNATTFHKILVYGPPKSGKTRLVGRLASTHKLLYVDNEQSTTTLLHPDNLQASFLPSIELIQLRDTPNYPIAAETILRLTEGKVLNICDAHGKHDCAICKKDTTGSATWVSYDPNAFDASNILVVDSLTQFTTSCMNVISLGKPDTFKFEHDHWAMLKRMMEKFMLWVQNVPMHVVCVTHEELLPMEDGKMRVMPAMGSSKFAPHTAKFFDHVVYLKLQGKDHKAGSSTGWDLQAVTGSRSNLKLETVDASKVYSPLSELFKNPIAKG
jgi:hypothetical protein